MQWWCEYVWLCGCCVTEIGGEVVSVDNWHDEPSKWNKQYQVITNSQSSNINSSALGLFYYCTLVSTTLTNESCCFVCLISQPTSVL